MHVKEHWSQIRKKDVWKGKTPGWIKNKQATSIKSLIVQGLNGHKCALQIWLDSQDSSEQDSGLALEAETQTLYLTVRTKREFPVIKDTDIPR